MTIVAPMPVPLARGARPRAAGAARALLALALLHALMVLVAGLGEPLVDLHSFRQTQTALSAFWMARDGFGLAYETPVVGAPWSIPFEFPLFQGIVAALSRLGLPLDAAGRAAAFAFFLGALWPLRRLFRHLRLDAAFPYAAILFLACPTLLYWGRAFLIESCATFFGLLWLTQLAGYADGRRPAAAILATGAGCCCALVKITTFPGFALLGGLVVASHLRRAAVRREPWRAFSAWASLAVLAPLAAGAAWVAFSDAVKRESAVGSALTSGALSAWNYGTAAQRLGPALWEDAIWNRALPEALGLLFPAALALLAASLLSRRYRAAVAAALAAWLLPFLLFTNLHVVHDYYQSANAPFIVAAVGLALAWAEATLPRPAAFALLVLLAAGQLAVFYGTFWPAMRLDGGGSRLYRIALLARGATAPDQGLVVLGDDWSSLVPYYAERKSLVLPPWAPAAAFDDPRALLGGRSLGAIVYCGDKLASYGTRAPAVLRLVAEGTPLAEIGGCALLGVDAPR